MPNLTITLNKAQSEALNKLRGEKSRYKYVKDLVEESLKHGKPEVDRTSETSNKGGDQSLPPFLRETPPNKQRHPPPSSSHPTHSLDELIGCKDCYPNVRDKVLAKEKEIQKNFEFECVNCQTGVKEDDPECPTCKGKDARRKES